MRALAARLPAHVINGAAAALGIALVHVAALALGGAPAAVAASSGAVFASLADVPNAPSRTLSRVLAAGVVGCAVSLLVALLRPLPLSLALLVAAIGFTSALVLAWGPRAGPMSFVGVMAFVFSRAAPHDGHWNTALSWTAWVAFGVLAYLAWALLAALVLQPRYRTLALAAVLQATAGLLRSRAALLSADAAHRGAATLRVFIADEARLDERTQAARDLLFPALHDATARRQSALLLLAIDLRDSLLLGQLDVDLLGQDAVGARVRHALAGEYGRVAAHLDALGAALRTGRMPAPRAAAAATPPFAAIAFEPADPRARLLPALADRLRHVDDDVGQMDALMRGGTPRLALEPEALRLFLSVEGWPLAALRPHASLASPVMRHALRAGAAYGTAYLIALALPWAAHPHWLVLSVAVVLRGNLEQTLSRRNVRVAGTVAGCAVVLALSQFVTPALSSLAFFGAAGLAHAYAVAHYFVAAAAATVMALLQDHLANPHAGFAVAERLADTVVGALLAWGFSYLLPSWERRGTARLAARLVRALDALAEQTLRNADAHADDVPLRLARRETYDALRGLSAAAQRSRAEPARVRVPLRDFAALLAASHALMAQLAAVKLMLARRRDVIDPAQVGPLLEAAAADVRQRLAQPHGTTAAAATDADVDPLPAQAPAQALTPWLRRRLDAAARAATRVAQAATALTAACGAAAQADGSAP